MSRLQAELSRLEAAVQSLSAALAEQGWTPAQVDRATAGSTEAVDVEEVAARVDKAIETLETVLQD